MTENGVLERRSPELPPEYQQKVLDCIDSHSLDIQREKGVKPSLNWAGGLSDLQKTPFSGVTLMKYLTDTNIHLLIPFGQY
jgi:hypothetical protein